MKIHPVFILIYCVIFLAIIIKAGVEGTSPTPVCEEGYVYIQPYCVLGYHP